MSASAAAAVYLEQKIAQRCTYHRCTRDPADGSQLCERHRKKQRRRDAGYKKTARSANRAKGLCAFCPTPSKTYRCPRHQVRDGFVPRSVSVRSGVDKSARIAAMTSVDAGNRTRYRGQGKRGMQPRAQLNRQDLAMARAAFVRGEQGLDLLETPAVLALPRMQRDGVRDAAAHQLDLAGRHIDDVLERIGHFKQRHGRRDGE